MPSEVAPLHTVVVKHARDAFRTPERIAGEWHLLGFTTPPDLGLACAESDTFVALLEAAGAEVLQLGPDDRVNLDSIYPRDAAIVSSRGVIQCRMGKSARSGEPDRLREACANWGVPVAGVIEPPGMVEGGDFIWLADRVAAIGRGYRTNDAGIAQLRTLLGETIDELIVVPLPHWRGPGDVFHLMSIVSPVDHDLAVVYAPLLSVPFQERLIDLGYTLVEVPHDEFETMGANVLALAPRRCVMVEGNPLTRERLERDGAEVLTYAGREISLKGGGGPTCLTRPLERRTKAHPCPTESRLGR